MLFTCGRGSAACSAPRRARAAGGCAGGAPAAQASCFGPSAVADQRPAGLPRGARLDHDHVVHLRVFGLVHAAVARHGGTRQVTGPPRRCPLALLSRGAGLERRRRYGAQEGRACRAWTWASRRRGCPAKCRSAARAASRGPRGVFFRRAHGQRSPCPGAARRAPAGACAARGGLRNLTQNPNPRGAKGLDAAPRGEMRPEARPVGPGPQQAGICRYNCR